jgi:hypothetical protein
MALVGLGVAVSLGMNRADTTLYERYAREALGSPFLHSLPREYPAASLVIFVVPLALPLPYYIGFALFAGACGLVLTLCSDGLAQFPGWSRRVCLYMLCGVGVVVFTRYDIFPALTAFLAVEGARRGKWGRAWAWAVLGGLVKLFPFLLLPGFLIAERRQTGKWPFKRLLVAFIPVAMVTVAQLLVAPTGSILSPLRYEMRRGFEISSLAGTLTFLADPFHVHWISGFDTVEVVGAGHVAIGMFVAAAGVVAMGAVWVLAWRDRLPLEAVSLALLSVAVLSDKAFGPQYLVWLIPFWAYWPLRRGWIWAALLTSPVYPWLYLAAHTWGPGFYPATAILAVRNTVLIVATAGWLVEQLRNQGEIETGLTDTAPSGKLGEPESAPALAS